MDSQKRENLLNMALDATPRERMESAALGTGYDFEERTWELIVRYSGDLTPLKEMGVQVKELLGGYAVLKAPEGLVDEITRLPQILYMEKPKLLYFAVNMGRSASCLSQVQSGGLGLTGTGVLVAVIDSGIDYFLVRHNIYKAHFHIGQPNVGRNEIHLFFMVNYHFWRIFVLDNRFH